MRKPDYIPQPSRHASGNAVVRLCGKDFYLGAYGSPEAKQQYDALIATWIANGRSLPEAQRSVNELILAYLAHAEEYYRESPKEREKITLSVRPLKDLYGRTEIPDFSPTKLKAVRQRMLDIQRRTIATRNHKRGKIGERTVEYHLSRRTINMRIGVIKRMFKWGVENEMVPSFVYQALEAVAGLKAGRSTAKEPKKVKPVPEASVEAVVPQLNRHLRAMVQLQQLTAARSGELCRIKEGLIDKTAKVNGVSLWLYRPTHHKNKFRDKPREIFLGPKAIKILEPFLTGDPDAYLFSPKQVMEERWAVQRAARKSKVQPSQKSRKKANPKRLPGERYSVSSYRKAILKACAKARVEPWHPHQLRHSAATYIRKMHGIELARIILGHSTAFTTEIYAEEDRQKAMAIMSDIG
jgi:integrase